MDGCAPRRRLAAVLTRVIELAEAEGLRLFNTFHAGDDNIHPVILELLAVASVNNRT